MINVLIHSRLGQEANAMRHIILGCPVDDLAIEDLLDLVARSLAGGIQQWYTSINVANWYAYTHYTRVAGLIDQAPLISADGWPIYWASRILYGIKIPRIPAMEFFDAVCRTFAGKPLRVYLLGGRPGVPELAGSRLLLLYPGLQVVGQHHGYLTTLTEQEAVLSDIQTSGADLLVLGMGTPREQSWLTHNLARSSIRFALGIGGGLDILAGLNSRAPIWMQRTGLEWLYRLVQEPMRLGPRYATTSWAFFNTCVRTVLVSAMDLKHQRDPADRSTSTKKGA